jgi:hypothetical protein
VWCDVGNTDSEVWREQYWQWEVTCAILTVRCDVGNTDSEKWRGQYWQWEVTWALLTVRCDVGNTDSEMWRGQYWQWDVTWAILTVRCDVGNTDSEMFLTSFPVSPTTCVILLQIRPLSLPSTSLLIYSGWEFSRLIHISGVATARLAQVSIAPCATGTEK